MISKQVIVMRTDLNMRKGKMIAQGAHASMKSILDCLKTVSEEDDVVEKSFCMEKESPLFDWITGRFTKICVGVGSEEELMEIYRRAEEAYLQPVLITDAGLTEFGGVPTRTCLAIGPWWSEDIDKITGHLKLL